MSGEPEPRRRNGPRILYVARGEVGATVRAAVDCVEGVPLSATDGTDAIKRLEDEAVDLAVVPATLPDVPLDVFLRWVDDEGAGPPIVVGEVDRASEPMIQVAGDVSAGALADRIERALVDRRLGGELDRHDRLRTALLRVVGSVIDAREPERVERIVYDGLHGTNAYRSVWVGRVDPDAGTVQLTQPIRHDTSLDEVGALIGGGDGAFVRQAVESGDVTTTDASPAAEGDGAGSRTRSGDVDGGAEADGLALTAVPFYDGERCHGVALLSTAPAEAPDAAERSLLGRLGRTCGAALVDRTGDDGEAVERMEGLLRVVAHELRNPLQVAAMSLEAAREDGDEAAFERLSDALESMEAVVDTTVDMAIHGDVDELEETDVHEVSVAAWRDVREPPAELTIAEPATVEADPDQLERLLSNLLRNAIDHAGTDVSVRVGTLPDGGGFYVEDDGPGIPPTERESAFEWGYTTNQGSLGVGLPFVREIADAHGWTVSVTAAGGGGARVEVRTEPERAEPRDELTRLFSEESTSAEGDTGGFEFRDARAE